MQDDEGNPGLINGWVDVNHGTLVTDERSLPPSLLSCLFVKLDYAQSRVSQIEKDSTVEITEGWRDESTVANKGQTH
jgi:hypothetical protein